LIGPEQNKNELVPGFRLATLDLRGIFLCRSEPEVPICRYMAGVFRRGSPSE
jgi:hypothetical protein